MAQEKPDKATGLKLQRIFSAVNEQERSIRLGNQIVVRVADNFDLGKFANHQFATHVNPSVNVRRVGLAAGGEKVTGDR